MHMGTIREHVRGLWKKHRTVLKIGVIGAVICMFAGGFYWQVSLTQHEVQENWGIAEAKETPVNSKVAGRVVQLYVKEGDTVEKGQLLARIDKDTQETDRTQAEASLRAQYAQLQATIAGSQTDAGVLAAQVNSAKAQAVQAKTALALAARDEIRYRELLDQSAISVQQYDQAKAQLDNAQAAYDAAQAGVASAEASEQKNAANAETVAAQRQQLAALQGKIDAVAVSEKETEIRAPFSGMITKKYVEENALVSQTTPLFSIQDSKDNWVIFKVKETDLGQYHVGDVLTLTGRDKTLKIDGTIEMISRKADYAAIKATNERGDKDIVTFDVKVRTDSPDVWPGMRFMLPGLRK